jgi:hypothetical protein
MFPENRGDFAKTGLAQIAEIGFAVAVNSHIRRKGMSSRWFAPICALLLLGFVSPATRAQGGGLDFSFSTEPDKIVDGGHNLTIRPNTGRGYYLFVTNKTNKERNATIQLTDAAGKTVYAETPKLELLQNVPTRIKFAKPPAPMPPAGAVVPAAAVAPMPMPKAPPLPPGVEIAGAYNSGTARMDFKFKVRIFDDRDPKNPSVNTECLISIPQPTTYVETVDKNTVYEKSGSSNELSVEIAIKKPSDPGKPAELPGTARCPVELSFPPQPGLDVQKLREGVYKQYLSNDKNSVRLYSKNLPLTGVSQTNGYVYVAIDSVPRSFVFRPKLFTDTGETPAEISRQTDAAIRYMLASKIETERTIYVRPGIVPIRVEADVAPLNSGIQLTLKRISEDEVVQRISHPVVREERVWLEAAAPDGGLLVNTMVGDWIIPLDVRDYRGRYELRATLVNLKNKDKPFAEYVGTFVVDDTKPEDVRIEVLPDRPKNVDPPRHVRTLPLPVQVFANDPESKIVKVVVFLGKPAPDGKVPETAVVATPPDPTRPGTPWVAQLPLPMGAKGVQHVTAVVTNAVGLSETGAQKIQLLDPPMGGTIRGIVAMRAGGKPLTGVTVILRDSEGKDKATAKTAEKTQGDQKEGVFLMKDVPPGTYRLFAVRPDSGVGTRAVETVTVKAGETSTVRMILSRKP